MLVLGSRFKVDLRRVCSHSEKFKQVWLFTRSIAAFKVSCEHESHELSESPNGEKSFVYLLQRKRHACTRRAPADARGSTR